MPTRALVRSPSGRGVGDPCLSPLPNEGSPVREGDLEPLADYVTSFIVEWERTPASSPEELGRQYIDGLYRLLRDRRQLFMVLLTTHVYEIGEAGDTGKKDSPLSLILEQIETWVERMGDAVDSEVDRLVAPRSFFATIFGMAVLDEWLFPAAKHPSDARIVRGVADQLVNGLAPRPTPTPT